MPAFLDYDKFQASLSGMVLPTCAVIKGKFKFVGTSFLCAYAGHMVIINAGHTVKDADAGGYELATRLPNGETHSLLTCNTKFIDNGKMDVAISVRPLEEAKTILDKGASLFDLCSAYHSNLPKFGRLIFTGYPASRYKPNANTPRAEFVSYTIESVHPPYCKDIAYKIDEEYHIVGRRTPPKEKVSRTDANGAGTRVDLPKLAGMSGGPVFWYDPEIGARPYFAGIGISDLGKKGYVVALKAEAMIAALNDYFKEK